MFDSRLELGIKLPSPEGVKKVSVAFPSATDWYEWRRKKRITQRDLGRRSSQIDPSKPEQADVDLFRKIVRTAEDASPVEVDESEAFFIVNKLAECEVTERPERDGNTFVLRLKIFGKLETIHRLRVPTMREMMDYERQRSAVTFGQYGTQEIRINFQASAELYDRLVKEVTGYEHPDPKDIPVPHKAQIVNELLQELRAEQEEDEPGE
jgi:hypothetical protein